jgi:Cu/Ag efflux pump CusA
MEGQLRFPLTIRLPDQIRSSPEEISNILVASVGFVPMAISSGAGA